GDAANLQPGAMHQICVANPTLGGSGCTQVSANGSTPTGTTPTPTPPGTTPPPTEPQPTSGTPPTTTTPPVNSAPACGTRERQRAAKLIARERTRRGSRSAAQAAAAANPPSALQGQCTLPPRGPCLGEQGALIDGGPIDDMLNGTPKGDTMNG